MRGRKSYYFIVYANYFMAGWVPGQYGSASANFGSLEDVTAFSNAFLNNPYVGVRNENDDLEYRFSYLN